MLLFKRENAVENDVFALLVVGMAGVERKMEDEEEESAFSVVCVEAEVVVLVDILGDL